jgi:tRNA modification GTPase
LFKRPAWRGRAIRDRHTGNHARPRHETADINGLRVELVDTAGIRDAPTRLMAEGVARARQAWTMADLVMVVLDGSQPLEAADHQLLRETSELPRMVVGNKQESAAGVCQAPIWICPLCRCHPGQATGLDCVRQQLRSTLEGPAHASSPRDSAAVTNVRHAHCSSRARDALRHAVESVDQPGGPAH